MFRRRDPTTLGRLVTDGQTCSAWITLDGTATPAAEKGVNSSENVASITDNAVGDWTVTFRLPFALAGYAVAGTVLDDVVNASFLHIDSATAPTASALRIINADGALAARDQSDVRLLCVGHGVGILDTPGLGRAPWRDEQIGGWIAFDGTAATPTATDHDNVGSITDNGAGDWTLVWIRAFGAATYGVAGMARWNALTTAGARPLGINTTGNITATSVRLRSTRFSDDTDQDSSYVAVMAIG